MIYMWIAQFKITSVDRALTVMLVSMHTPARPARGADLPGICCVHAQELPCVQIVYVCLNIFFAGHAMRSVLREQGRRFDLAKMTELAHLNL